LPLSSDAIHVWTFRLDIADWRDRLAPGWLSDDELLRAERSAFEEHRRRFVVCRTALRAILGGYLARPPGELKFHQGPHGKPRVDPARSHQSIHFNVSHSDELALVAVSRQRELGVDLERVRPLDGIDDIVARHFSPAERLAFSRVPPTTRLATFYRHWTLKEACLKACGVGLSGGLARIDVTRAEDHPIRLPDVSGAGAGRDWTGRTIDPVPGYVAALVAEGTGASVTTMSGWPLAPLTLPAAPHTVGATTPAHG